MFEYLFKPFSLHNAAQTFQSFMDRLFKHLPFVFTYLDDHIIAICTVEEHYDQLRHFLPSFRKMACRSTLQSVCLQMPSKNALQINGSLHQSLLI
jgi:hypothetical protein